MESPVRPETILSGRGDSFMGGLFVASNREPCSHRKTPAGLSRIVPVGGLVSALDAVLRVTGGTWIAWGSGSGDREGADGAGRLWVPADNPAYSLQRVWLTHDDVRNYYHGFCNLVLWPLFHGEPDRIRYENRFWDGYRNTNRLFADTILGVASEDSTLWIHDYHLCLVAGMLRAKAPCRTISHFWHVPWPEPGLFLLAPHCAEIIAGLLGNDLIGFQIPSHAEHFLACAAACLGATVDYRAMSVTWQGRTTQVRAFPISIDFDRFDTLGRAPATTARSRRIRTQFRLPELVGLAVDRLDYTKGIIPRLDALDHFFRCNSALCGRFTLVQVAVMTRNEAPYRCYRQELEERIAEINGRYGMDGWQPVLYFRDGLDQEELAAWYHLADVAMITPLRDGMNLVAKEYAATRHDGGGMLILGKGAGAAAELTDALLVDPRDTEGFAAIIHRALAMPEPEKSNRMAGLRDRIRKHTIYHWAGDILDELALLPAMRQGCQHALSCRGDIRRRLAGRDLLLLLDFDGTLAPIVERPETAAMPDSIHCLVQALKERHTVAVISGRSLDDLRKRVNLPGIIYGGNHGAEMDGCGSDVTGRPFLAEFLSDAHDAFASFPGVQIEDKGVTASIHFRRMNPAHLDRFLTVFRQVAGQYKDSLAVTVGRKVFEIRPPTAITKGDAVRLLMDGIGAGRFPVYVGDDRSDDEGFRAVRGVGMSVSIGGSPEAEYYLRNQGEVGEFLAIITGVSGAGEEQRCPKGDRKGVRP